MRDEDIADFLKTLSPEDKPELKWMRSVDSSGESWRPACLAGGTGASVRRGANDPPGFYFATFGFFGHRGHCSGSFSSKRLAQLWLEHVLRLKLRRIFRKELRLARDSFEPEE
jgi:hypothetical protein